MVQQLNAHGLAAKHLRDGHTLRLATKRDLMSLHWLLSTSRWSYHFLGGAKLRSLLSKGIGVVWTHAGRVQGFCLFDTYRAPIAACHLLAIRQVDGDPALFDRMLAYAEDSLRSRGMHWSCIVDGEPWLIGRLARNRYALETRVVHYALDTGNKAKTRRAKTASSLCITPSTATWSDLDRVLAVDHQAFAPFWQVNAAILQHSYERSPFFWVARLEGDIVGYLIAEQTATQIYVSRLGVATAWQRHGVGQQLLNTLLALAQREGIDRVALNTQEDNTVSRAFYERAGFALTGESTEFWAKRLDGIPAENCDSVLTSP